MNNFVYYAPTKVFFGKGEELKIGQILMIVQSLKTLKISLIAIY